MARANAAQQHPLLVDALALAAKVFSKKLDEATGWRVLPV
jgi:hypothetical protein